MRSFPSILIILALASGCLCIGRVKHECPDGFFLSDFKTIYDAATRLYSFGCSALSSSLVEKEKCRESDPASSLNGDMFLKCEPSEYPAGVSILKDMKQQRWSLLCCSSPSVSLRFENCQLSPFINEFSESGTFSSAGKVMRTWQSLYNETLSDRKWWVELCPFNVRDGSSEKKTLVQSTRFTRNVPDRFGPSRFMQIPRIAVPRKQVSRIRGKTEFAQDRLLSKKGYPGKLFSQKTRRTSTRKFSTTTEPFNYYDDLYEDMLDNEDMIPESKDSPSESLIQTGNEEKQVPAKMRRLFTNIQDGLDIASIFISDEIEGFHDPLPPTPPPKTHPFNQQQQPLKKGALQNVMEYLGLCPGIG